MSERVKVTLEGGVADVRLARPEKRNALDEEMFHALVSTGTGLAAERSLRAVALSGEGRCFCAGLDFGSFAAMAQRGASGSEAEGAEVSRALLDRRERVAPANFAQSAAWVWHQLPVPVIAGVHGVAYGGGLQVALGADIRLVAPDARLSVMEINWGLIPDMSGPQLLRRLVRWDVAKELTFTGRVVSGEEAVVIGLATRLADDPREAALELAREIAAKSPHAIRAAKRLLNEVPETSTAAGLALEQELQRSLIGTPNQTEAVRANFEKREAVFADVS